MHTPVLYDIKYYPIYNIIHMADGCLDFGTIRVFEETKLSLRMKNQGKYEIAYKWVCHGIEVWINCISYGLIFQPLSFTLTELYFTVFHFSSFLSIRFTLERTDTSQPKLDSIFTVSPQYGSLMPHEKPTTVQIICRPNREVLIKEQPILPCQVYIICTCHTLVSRAGS